MKKVLSLILVFILVFTMMPISAEAATKVYYNIDFSQEVLASRINQKVSGDCGVVSMATTESYLYGAKTAAAKTTVYNALVSANKDNDWAYWGNCGYAKKTIDWKEVYYQISQGYPCLIHRPASGSADEHWAVVCGYKGSTTTLQSDKFVVVDVYLSGKYDDITNVGAWRGSTTVDAMVYRKNGISITGLSGIHFAMNHPPLIKESGKSHGVYGYITSNSNLLEVSVKVTNITTDKVMLQKSLTPNAKSYNIYKLDSDMTFASWPDGEYYYTVYARNASTSSIYNYYFRIASSWPSSDPTPKYTLSFNANGGTGTMKSFDVAINEDFTLTPCAFTRAGYAFSGWICKRSDGKWMTNNGWRTDAEIDQSGYTYKVYEDCRVGVMSGWWLQNSLELVDFTFYAVWEPVARVLEKLELVSAPTKTVYKIGESLNTDGLKLKATYSDGTSETVTNGFTVSGFDSSVAGNKTVTVSYGGKSVTFTVTIEKKPVEEKNFVKWYSGTTSLNGTIDLNIYVLLSDDLVNADDTFVRFTYAGQTVDVPMSKALYSPLDTAPNRYRFSCPIYAKQLTDAVNVKFMKGDAVIGSELNYSVVTYCKNRISKSTDPAEVAICKAMLNYGAASQQLFNYNTDNLANASLSDADKVLKDVNASAYAYSVSGSESGIKAKSATLMLEDVVKVRVYFTLTGNKTIDEYTFTIDGKVVTPQYNDKGWYVETDGIAAKDLEKMFQVKVGGITVKYGALSYVNSKVGGSNALESNISKALYAYWQAAEALLG